MNRLFTLILVYLIVFEAFTQNTELSLARLQYHGGGDWYVGPTSLTNLAAFCNEKLNTKLSLNEEIVEVGSVELFNYPFVYMTGHGNVDFSKLEANNLRTYLEGGGFLFINDSYGMDKFVRSAMKKVFPELKFIELPYSHEIYNKTFDFTKGLPKIHEHDDKSPQGFGILFKGRLVCFYNYECDLGDGWEDPEVHEDPEELRIKALKMGANIIEYVFNDSGG